MPGPSPHGGAQLTEKPACHLRTPRSTTRPDEELVSTKDSAQISIHDTEGGKGRLPASPAHSILCVSAHSANRDSGRVQRHQNSTRPKITVHYRRKNLLDCSVAKETKNGSCFLKTLLGASFVTLLTRLFMVFTKSGNLSI